MSKKLWNGVLVAVGFLCIGIGSVGVFLPVLPTAPFYLLALACFAKGSKRFHAWFTGTGLYKKHLESFAKNRSMTLKTKLCIVLPVTAMLLLAAAAVPSLPMRIALAALLALKYYYFIFKIKTIRGGAGCE
jgi:uncharacterized membrane protein YbaN (DUF454 family)